MAFLRVGGNPSKFLEMVAMAAANLHTIGRSALPLEQSGRSPLVDTGDVALGRGLHVIGGTMKTKSLLILLLIAVTLSGCSIQPTSLQAFDGALMPTLEPPRQTAEKAGPLLVTPTSVALGKEIEVKIEDVKPEEMSGLGIALLDPSGARVSTVTPVQGAQTLAVPADGKPGAYKVWLARSTFAANTGINLVVVDVYDAVPPTLRNPDPLKVVEAYLNAVTQKNNTLAWQALSSGLSSAGRSGWLRGFEATVDGIRSYKINPQQIPLKETDKSYRCSVDLEIKTRAKGILLGATSRTTRHFTLAKESGGWRIDRISLLP